MKIKNIVNVINYVVFTLILIMISVTQNKEPYILLIFFLFIATYTVRVYFFSERNRNNLFKYVLFLAEIIFVFLISYNTKNYIASVIYLFLIDTVIMDFKVKMRYFFIVLVYGVSCISVYLMTSFNLRESTIFALVSVPIYLLFIIIFHLINYLIHQNEIIEDALKEVTVKKVEKDIIYNDLSEAYKKVQEMTASNERNKIAREIHDTVGHTLTTVLVELEAAKRLMEKDKGLALEKLNLAQGQVRKGLNNIRTSVRILEKGEKILDFKESLVSLIEECEKHSEIVIRSQINLEYDINEEMQNIIFSSLQEGLTNGIRHGKSTAFLFKLIEKDNEVVFSLEDNGLGSFALTPGFGLRAMKDRVKNVNGSLEIETSEGEGFSIYIRLPVGSGQLTMDN